MHVTNDAEVKALQAVMDDDEPEAGRLLRTLAGHELRGLANHAERLAQLCHDADPD